MHVIRFFMDVDSFHRPEKKGAHHACRFDRGVTVAFAFLGWGVFAAQYIWPSIRKRERAEALRPILVLHGFRYIGLAALISRVVSPQLSGTPFALELAYGDLAAATPGPSRARDSQDEIGRNPGLDLQHFRDRSAECVLSG